MLDFCPAFPQAYALIISEGLAETVYVDGIEYRDMYPDNVSLLLGLKCDSLFLPSRVTTSTGRYQWLDGRMDEWQKAIASQEMMIL